MKMKKLLIALLLLAALSGCNKQQDKIVTKNSDDLIQMFEAGETFVVYAGTENCESCKVFKRTILELLDAYQDKKLYYFPADDYQSEEVKNVIYNYLYKLEYTPSIYYVDNGKVVDMVEGLIDYDQLKDWLKKHDFISD